MSATERRPEINMSGIPVRGIGGLGLVAVAALMTVVMPEARNLVVAAAIGGVILGAALIVFHRVHRTSGPSGNDPTILFRAEPRTDRTVAPSSQSPSQDVSLASV